VQGRGCCDYLACCDARSLHPASLLLQASSRCGTVQTTAIASLLLVRHCLDYVCFLFSLSCAPACAALYAAPLPCDHSTGDRTAALVRLLAAPRRFSSDPGCPAPSANTSRLAASAPTNQLISSREEAAGWMLKPPTDFAAAAPITLLLLSHYRSAA
jgi:hypothetical protein